MTKYHNITNDVLINVLSNTDQQNKRGHQLWGIEFIDGPDYHEMDHELESRAPVDDIVYFGDCAGLEVFCQVEYYDENGELIEPIQFLGHPQEDS